MIKQLKAWYNKQLEKAKDRDYLAGYDLAAGTLLRGEGVTTFTSYDIGYPISANQGAQQAFDDFNKQLRTRRGSDGVEHYNSIKPVIKDVCRRPSPWPPAKPLV